jgi:hypothetical protein
MHWSHIGIVFTFISQEPPTFYLINTISLVFQGTEFNKTLNSSLMIENTDSSQNAGLLTIQPPYVAASSRNFIVLKEYVTLVCYFCSLVLHVSAQD